MYATGTEIELTDYAYNQYGIKFNERPCAVFISQNENSQTIYCLIKGMSCVSIPNSSLYIKGIIKPIYCYKKPALESAIENFVTKQKTPDVFNGWLWYILIIMFLFICKNSLSYIFATTLIFVFWLIKKYQG
jgi:hypothetical protein